MTPGQQYYFRAQSVDIDTHDFHPENIGESLLSFTVIPEPSTAVLAIAGLLSVCMARRARRGRK